VRAVVASASNVEVLFERRVFPHWSIAIPAGMDETTVESGGYWNASDERRSISLTSLILTDKRGRRLPAKHVGVFGADHPGRRASPARIAT